jgi:hypothetical protein
MVFSKSLKYCLLAAAVVALVLFAGADAKKNSSDADDTITHKVFFDIEINGEPAGELFVL